MRLSDDLKQTIAEQRRLLGNRWTQEQIDYLRESWGTVSINDIAKTLRRTVSAVQLEARKLKLGRMLEASDYITLNQLMRILRCSDCNRWINNRQFPVKYKQLLKRTVRIVYINDFWKWASKNRNAINFAKIEPNIFGKEPQWVKRQREIDRKHKFTLNNKLWTKEQDQQLACYLEQYKYSYDELSKLFGRSNGAISGRISTLQLKQRPITPTRNKWTDAEIERLKQGIMQSYTYDALATTLGRSVSSVKMKVYKMFNICNLEKAREILTEETC